MPLPSRSRRGDCAHCVEVFISTSGQRKAISRRREWFRAFFRFTMPFIYGLPEATNSARRSSSLVLCSSRSIFFRRLTIARSIDRFVRRSIRSRRARSLRTWSTLSLSRVIAASSLKPAVTYRTLFPAWSSSWLLFGMVAGLTSGR